MIALKAVVKSTGVNESLHYLSIPPNSASQIKKKQNKKQPLIINWSYFFNCPWNRLVSAENEACLCWEELSNGWKTNSPAFCSPVCQWPWGSHFVFIFVFSFEKIMFSHFEDSGFTVFELPEKTQVQLTTKYSCWLAQLKYYVSCSLMCFLYVKKNPKHQNNNKKPPKTTTTKTHQKKKVSPDLCFLIWCVWHRVL